MRRSASQPLVTAIVLSWNARDLAIDCLVSLNQLEYQNLEIVLVDNGSSDDTSAAVRAQFPHATVIENQENLGYAEGNNVGLKYALATGTDYAFVVNNDTLVDPNMLTTLVDFAESNPQVGMVGPTMFCVEPSETLFAAGSFIDWDGATLRHRGMFQVGKTFGNFERPEPVDFIVGCGVLISRIALEAIRGFDTAYHMNYEDVDWGHRSWASGFEVWHIPKAIMWHKVSATLGKGSPANTYYMTRNALRFFWKNSPRYMRWASVSKIVARTLRTVSAWSVKSEYRNDEFRRKRVANLFAIRDFALGRFGEMGEDVAEVCNGS